MPPGAYQQFTFGVDVDGGWVDFETSFTGEVVTGRMVEDGRTGDEARFCTPADRGGCQEMELTLWRDGTGVVFETRRSGEDHHRVVLRPAAP